MKCIWAALLILGAPEIGQHIVETPANIAELPPMIEVLRLAADIEQTIDRTRSAQHFAARLDDLAVVEIGLRLRTIEPVDLGVVEQLAVTERNVNPDVAVVSAGLQQQNTMTARGGQPISQDAAGRAGADDDIVKSISRWDRRHGAPAVQQTLRHSAPQRYCPKFQIQSAGSGQDFDSTDVYAD